MKDRALGPNISAEWLERLLCIPEDSVRRLAVLNVEFRGLPQSPPKQLPV